MQQVFIGIILFLSFTSYYLFNENKTLITNNALLETAISTQEEAIASIQEDFELQTTQMNELSLKSQKAQIELSRYTKFIQNYELSAKILANPKEMERKINNGTKYIMEDIEKISTTVDGLDNGLQLQSNSD
tara:strand:+ start:156 stop:551 length:396 start_codon:yes stop_codon:yes gene_type:complete